MIQKETFDLIKRLSIEHGFKIIVHNCHKCEYPCGYYYNEKGKLLYDSGCECHQVPSEKKDEKELLLYLNQNDEFTDRLIKQIKEDFML